jgi:hypothetical protein
MPCFYGNFPGAGRQAQKDFLPAGGIFCTSREEYEKTPGEGDKKEAGFAIMNLLIKITCRPRRCRDKGGTVEGKSTFEGEAAHRVKITGRHGEGSGAHRMRP